MSALRAIVICQIYFENLVISSKIHLFAPLLNMRRCTVWIFCEKFMCNKVDRCPFLMCCWPSTCPNRENGIWNELIKIAKTFKTKVSWANVVIMTFGNSKLCLNISKLLYITDLKKYRSGLFCFKNGSSTEDYEERKERLPRHAPK